MRRLMTDCSGASAVEYALLIAVIGLALALGAATLGRAIGNSINEDAATIQNCGGGC